MNTILNCHFPVKQIDNEEKGKRISHIHCHEDIYGFDKNKISLESFVHFNVIITLWIYGIYNAIWPQNQIMAHVSINLNKSYQEIEIFFPHKESS